MLATTATRTGRRRLRQRFALAVFALTSELSGVLGNICSRYSHLCDKFHLRPRRRKCGIFLIKVSIYRHQRIDNRAAYRDLVIRVKAGKPTAALSPSPLSTPCISFISICPHSQDLLTRHKVLVAEHLEQNYDAVS